MLAAVTAVRSEPVNGSAWAPFASKVYRALWIAQLVSNLGTWMQTVGAQWLLVDAPNAALLVSLVQVATTLPVMLLVIPAGVLADLVDRRRLLLVAQSGMALTATALAVITALGHTTPGILLGLLFVLGCGSALTMPNWQAIQPELVPREQIPAAAALNGLSVNGARAVGPAIAGVLVSLAGPTFVFALNAVSFAGIVAVLLWWRRPVKEQALPHERPLAALAAGFRFVRSGPAIRRVLLRAVLFMVPASALWALLPVVARDRLGLGSSGYGLMLGALGLGAVAGGLSFAALRARFTATRMLLLSALFFGGATLVSTLVSSVPLVLIALVIAGVGWPLAMSTLNSTMLLMLPAWVRARGMSVYTLVFMGGQAVGALVWGAVANALGVSDALTIAAALLGVCALSTLWWPVRQDATGFDLTPAAFWPEPVLVSEPEPADGPVLVLRRYRVPGEVVDKFLTAMARVGRSRQRTGAMEWRLYRDVGTADQYVEAFVVRSWDEHMRQHLVRLTAQDELNEQQATQYTIGDDEITHLIAVEGPGR
ncbi:MFS transporter [Nocardia huaxiensis]|uniref:MFS transporter n=1 Tax=Nocardia huaxiensis TaxID=2755382 RepID=UPI001E39FCE9|nr:MFS transporter [Nocardia huaxiensis]UFS97525.1 MFS transporter [Nocardia huaxiensis]